MMLLYLLYPFFLFLVFPDNSSNDIDKFFEAANLNQLTVDLGEDFSIDLGDSVQIMTVVQSTFPLQSISWNPVEGLSSADALRPYIYYPFSGEMCYTITIIDEQGSIATDDICVSQTNCEENAFTVNALNNINPNPENIGDKVMIEFQLSRTQFVNISLFQNGNLTNRIWESWYKKGQHELELNLVNVPNGTYDLVLDLYPEDISQTITITH